MDKFEELRKALADNVSNLISKNQEITDLTIQQRKFGFGDTLECIRVLYISDLHIESHMCSLGVDITNKKSVKKYIKGLVERLFDKRVVQFMSARTVSPNNMADLLNGYYYLFVDETRLMTEEERKEIELQLRRGKIEVSVKPRLQKCLVIDGDLADNVNIAELFFKYIKERISSATSLDNYCPIYYVLGNHECSEYNSVDEAHEKYKKTLVKYGVTVLEKEYIEFGNCIVFGGIGFAKNNKTHNSSNLVGPKNMFENREVEAYESDKTHQEYQGALLKAKESNKPLIVISHYPLKDWMSSQVDDSCYYFTGHDHTNTISFYNNSYIYSDNQIGYDSAEIELKMAMIGTNYNPFIDFDDGIHEITIKQYSDFYKYTGEYVGIGLIKKQLTKSAKFYLIKQKGYYGFFIVNDKNTKICSGGIVKAISEITEIRYFYECFCTMVHQYIMALLPLRKYQEELSEAIKELHIPDPGTGRIHGCIVDVDFYHHIMINPYDGALTFYG